VDRLHAASDNAKPTLAASELSPEDARALVGQSADSPEIPESPKGACQTRSTKMLEKLGILGTVEWSENLGNPS
jgi:hypothetical protein